MTNMSHVDSMTVIGTRFPVENNTNLYFGDGYYEECDSYLDSYRHDVSPEWYHALNDFMDYMSYCEYMVTSIDIEALLDKNGNVNLLSKENIEIKKGIIKDHVEKQKLFLEKVEGVSEWKFLNDPEKYPFEQVIIIEGRLIRKEYKTSDERDSFLVGYNEKTYPDSLNDNYKDGDGDEEILDKSARESIITVKYLHGRLINAIDVNTQNLNKLNFTQSSVLAIPSPSVPTLPYSVGANSQVTQTANSNLTKGIEKTLGNIRDGLAETFDCSFGMSCSNDLDKAAKNPNVGMELSNSEKAKLGGSTSGTPDGWEPEDEVHARHKEQQQKNFEELTRVYDKDSPSQTITIDGQTIKQGVGGNRYSTRIYDSQNLTDQQIYNYAEQLAAQPLTKVKDGIYTAKLTDGTMITLRSVSSSAEQTGARWTVQIRNNPTLRQVENGLGRNAEIKFR